MEILFALLFYLMIGLVTLWVCWWRLWRFNSEWIRSDRLLKFVCALLIVVMWPYQWYLLVRVVSSDK